MSDLKLRACLPLNSMTQSPIINIVSLIFMGQGGLGSQFTGCLTVQLQNNICNQAGQIRQFGPEKAN